MAEECRRLAQRLEAGERKRFESRIAYFCKRLESCLTRAGFRCVNLEGRPIEMGIAASVLNLDEYSDEDELIVEQMIEPVIVGPQGVVRIGKAVAKKAAAE